MDPLTSATTVLTIISFLLVIGLALSIISEKIRIPDILLLLIIGIVLGSIKVNGEKPISLPQDLVFGIAIISLVMMVFTGTSTIKLREVDAVTLKATKLLLLFLLFSSIIMILESLIFFGLNLKAVSYGMILAIVSIGTDASAVFSLLKKGIGKIENLLKVESILNTPLVVVLPLVFIRILKEGYGNIAVAIVNKGFEIFKLFVIGIGAGVVMAIIIFKILHKIKERVDQQIMLFGGAFLTYTISEAIGGDGIISVATLGVIFATYYTRTSTIGFSKIVARILETLIFLLLGISIELALSFWFIVKSLLVFFGIYVARFLAVKFTLKGEMYTKDEQMKAALLIPKGIATGVTALTLALIDPSFEIISSIILAITIYSLIVASISLIVMEDGEKNANAGPSGK